MLYVYLKYIYMDFGPTQHVQIAKALGDDVSFARDIRLVTRKGLWT